MTFEKFYQDVLNALSGAPQVKTLTQEKVNKIKVENGIVYAATEHSNWDFIEIRRELFERTFEELQTGKWLSQNYLSKELYVKRSAVIFAILYLLPFIEYDGSQNAIRLKKL
ncbi:hypothetical protein ACFL6I_18085 [candidate division KSB1 bacterium]